MLISVTYKQNQFELYVSNRIKIEHKQVITNQMKFHWLLLKQSDLKKIPKRKHFKRIFISEWKDNKEIEVLDDSRQM